MRAQDKDRKEYEKTNELEKKPIIRRNRMDINNIWQSNMILLWEQTLIEPTYPIKEKCESYEKRNMEELRKEWKKMKKRNDRTYP